MLLFLDFDGVLHPFFPCEDRPDIESQPFSYRPRLEGVLREYRRVEIVICSDWRKSHSLEGLRGFFSEDIRPRILGVTPVLPKDRTGVGWVGIQHREALTWLEVQSMLNRPWVALDDDYYNWLPESPLVCCDDGFREVEEEALRAML